MTRLCLALILLPACSLSAEAQSPCSPVDYGTKNQCSFTGVNGPCTIIVDRRRPATPPTIYMRRGSKVNVEVINPSPLEKLELDETSINTQVPIDSVQALAPLLNGLGQFVLPLQQPLASMSAAAYTRYTPAAPHGAKSFDAIQQEQSSLSGDIGQHTSMPPEALTALKNALATLRTLLLPPLDACNRTSAWNVALADFPKAIQNLRDVNDAIQTLVGPPGPAAGGAGTALAGDATKLAEIQAYIDEFTSGMALDQKQVDGEVADLKTSNAALEKKIDEEQKKAKPRANLIQDWKARITSQQDDIRTKTDSIDQAELAWQVQLERLRSSQAALNDTLSKAQILVKTVLFPAEIKLKQLVDAIAVPPVASGPFPISDVDGNDKNDQQEVFTLVAVNDLTDPVKIFVAAAANDLYSQTLADAIVTTAPAKTAVMQVTVDYVTQPEMEVTAGILVPFLPYKSYAAAPQSAGSATLVAQETHTFTIVPTVNLNFRLGNDKFAGIKRYGWLGTVAAGYNPATAAVEFGVGPSLALKSMVFSLLADVGRDTELASGFSKNQPLPGSATTPATSTVWSVKPSFGFSIRLPFNSGGGH